MTDTLVRSGGQPFAADAMVTTDQVTIVGNGTTADPLRASAGSGGTIQASFRSGTPLPGMPVFIAFADLGGITTVQSTSVVSSPPDRITTAFASVNGMVASVNEDGTVQFQTSGLLTLTTDEWDTVTGQLGGLAMGFVYYASIFSGSDVFLDLTPPSAPGQWVTRVGTAINETTLLIQPSAPRQNLGDLILFGTWGGSPLPAGSVVRVSANSTVVGATDSSTTNARAIGVVCGTLENGNPIVQVAGSVTLDPLAWAIVTENSTILSAGEPYYVAPDAGKLAVTPPLSGQIVQVGVAFNGAVLVLTAPPQQTAGT